MNPVTVYDTPTGVESLQLPIETTADPIATTPKFALSAPGASAPGAWVAGAWSGVWSTRTQRTMAVTPLIGRTGSLVIASGNDYDLWVKATVGVESFEWPVGRVHCP